MKTPIQGLTLLELIVTITVLGIAAALAVPSFAAVLDRTRASTASHAITASLMAARMAAITRRHPVTVCPSIDGRRCSTSTDWSRGWIVFNDPLRTGQPTQGVDVLHRGDGTGTGIRVTTSAGRELIRYQPTGQASGTNASFRLCSTARSRLLVSVIVSNAGRARIERPRRDAPCGGTARAS